MRTITFYSYKGGVGRTLAAANFALYLAKLGHRTVIMDFDLDAPGVDSKLPNFELPQGQAGLVDYILEFQRTGINEKKASEICIQVPFNHSIENSNLWLIAAGDYLDGDYAKKLGELNWDLIFPPERNGVPFFQAFLQKIEDELQPDFVIVDSRTGISEIGGLCTQQLADEVVLLTSLNSESQNMTRRIGELIRRSAIATALKKSIDVKVVVSRVPEPKNIGPFKTKLSEIFGVSEEALFFVFSRPHLELEEYLAIESPFRDEDLVADYVRLFYGLNIAIANSNIKSEIEETVKNLLIS
jgi:MinD-like ATPase involved in chromosome partitioning or flagellar assembly